jgi:hypothetical protein
MVLLLPMTLVVFAVVEDLFDVEALRVISDPSQGRYGDFCLASQTLFSVIIGMHAHIAYCD